MLVEEKTFGRQTGDCFRDHHRSEVDTVADQEMLGFQLTRFVVGLWPAGINQEMFQTYSERDAGPRW